MSAAIALVCASLAWMNLSSVRDMDARLALAAVVSKTDATDHEQLLLMRIARFESAYVPRVVMCRRGTTQSGRGAFGVVARGPSEYAGACGYTVAAATLALARVRESVAESVAARRAANRRCPRDPQSTSHRTATGR